MKGLEFPLISTKVKGSKKKYDLESPQGRKAYFEAKVGDEILHIKKYLQQGNTFIAYLLAKKSAGKGTYSKLLTEIFGEDKIDVVSVGDLIREVDDWKAFVKTEKYKRMKKYYRGYVSFDDAVDALLGRSISKLLPSEFILALLKAHIDELSGKSIFIDGLPRDMDQISYSQYFRDLINFRNDPDMFVLIDIPESVIEERMKYRVICPICKTSRNIKLLPTSKVGYDKKSKKYYLNCDNPTCKGAKMEPKEGDDKGLAPIRERLDRDEKLIKQAFDLHGVPKVLARNHVPVKKALDLYEAYEITPAYSYSGGEKGKIKVHEGPFKVKDDEGKLVYSLLAPPVAVTIIKQLKEVLEV